jgi:Zn-finger nucleic acid-binding protein
MDCPVCKTVALMMSERQGIEIDYCPQCRGIWLDRGELDKLIDRASPGPALRQAAVPPPPPAGYGERTYERGGHDDHRRGHTGGYDAHGRKRKKEGFLADLFDF